MSRRSRQQTWTYAGAGLIVCGVGEMVQTSLRGTPGSDAVRILIDLVFAASILLFAFGLSRDASVVGRRPLGVTAMAVVALWPLADLASEGLLPLGPSTDDTAWMVQGYLSLIVPAAAGLVAAVQIARGDEVPRPWRWAPMWVLGAYAVTWVIPQVIFVTEHPENIQAFADLFQMLGSLASLAGTLGLGIVALVLAARQRPESVEVYPSP